MQRFGQQQSHHNHRGLNNNNNNNNNNNGNNNQNKDLIDCFNNNSHGWVRRFAWNFNFSLEDKNHTSSLLIFPFYLFILEENIYFL